MAVRREAVEAFLDQGPAMLVGVASARGSTPRDAGAWMLVSERRTLGTIGGGQLEYIAVDAARALMARGGIRQSLDVPLGPEIGQCCGGRTLLSVVRAEGAALEGLFALVAKERAALPTVLILGAGHVGRALAAALALLPVRPLLVDSREEELAMAPAGVGRVVTPLPEVFAPVTFVPVNTVMPCFLNDFSSSAEIASSSTGTSRSTSSMMVTSLPKRR